MREIKFREWNTDELEMYNIDLKDETLIGSDEYPLMQYTGLKDKNGVEIYEGDIVKSASGKIATIRINDCILEWDIYPPYHWRKDNIRTFGIMSKGHANLSEVVGNIHQNPELLESK